MGLHSHCLSPSKHQLVVVLCLLILGDYSQGFLLGSTKERLENLHTWNEPVGSRNPFRTPIARPWLKHWLIIHPLGKAKTISYLKHGVHQLPPVSACFEDFLDFVIFCTFPTMHLRFQRSRRLWGRTYATVAWRPPTSRMRPKPMSSCICFWNAAGYKGGPGISNGIYIRTYYILYINTYRNEAMHGASIFAASSWWNHYHWHPFKLLNHGVFQMLARILSNHHLSEVFGSVFQSTCNCWGIPKYTIKSHHWYPFVNWWSTSNYDQLSKQVHIVPCPHLQSVGTPENSRFPIHNCCVVGSNNPMKNFTFIASIICRFPFFCWFLRKLANNQQNSYQTNTTL